MRKSRPNRSSSGSQPTSMMFYLVIAVFCVVTNFFGKSCKLDTLGEWAKARIKKLGGCDAIAAGGDVADYNDAPKVKLFLYTNDEWELLSDFLQYYSYVFSANNIIVIDQNSKMETVCKTMALFQACGTTVVTTNESFALKDTTLTKEMLKYNDTFLIPLDTDEFIFSYAEDSDPRPVVDRRALWKALKNLPIDGRKYKYGSMYAVVPGTAACAEIDPTSTTRDYRRTTRNDRFSPPVATKARDKTFFYSDGFIRTDAGNHYGEVKHDRGRINLHPGVEPSFPFYFTPLYAPLIHYGTGSYFSTREKFVRIGVQMGYDAKFNCSSMGAVVNGHYCPVVHDYVHGADQGMRRYTNPCRNKNMVTYTLVAEWFLNNTLSVHQLTGV